MAEFQEVMRQFDRMCEAHAGCYNCPLHEPNGADMCSIGAFVKNPGHIEHEVMKWVAEYQEPVYPTWYEYLISESVLVPRSNYTTYDLNALLLAQLKNTFIPADIAQKLGIEPKEKV